ncbi:MAG: flagellar hook-basal body complex protein [Clostridiales bacterium]|nr:flagellar hook-basal body complex protein [Clostridiales bacterium]
MLRCLYMAGTSMLVQRKKLDVLTNNITNIETIGYKRDQLLSRSFKDMLIQNIDDPSVLNISRGIGPLNTGIHIDEVVTGFEQGNLEETGRLTDLAIEGLAFFTVSTPDGERYTRDGSFGVDREGFLANSDGHYLQGTSGRIHVGTGKFSVDSQGNVIVGGVTVNTLRLAAFEDLTGLRKEGNNLFVNYTNQGIAIDSTSTVKQGFLEMSNVDITRQTIEMMEVSRIYELNQSMIKMIDESLAKTVNEVGRV